VEQKNWARVRELVGYYRYDTKAERDLLNAIWDLTMALSRKIWPSPGSWKSWPRPIGTPLTTSRQLRLQPHLQPDLSR
jgi:hypothetical protein